jgi:hypothetical protein
MWEREPSLPEEITKAWQSGVWVQNLGDVANTLHTEMPSLKKWSHEKFGVVTKELKKIRTTIEELLYREEMMWLQRSRVSLLKEGDCNTQKNSSESDWEVKEKHDQTTKKGRRSVHQ